MAIVSPSILSADFGKLGADCRMVLDAGAQMLHYDVMDGHCVPNISFGVPVLKSLHKALPDAFYDVHLMISHPLQYAEPFIKAGATLYNFHLECEDDIQATLDAVKALGCKTGLTIKPGTAPEALVPYLDQLDLWKQVRIFWWRAALCSAQQTMLLLCSSLPPFERITIYG